MATLKGKMVPSPFKLTPYSRMRKKRPSYSPVKKTDFEKPASRAYSSNSSTLQTPSILSSTDHEALDTGLASLQFEEFSWDDGKGGYKSVTAAHFLQLNKYLQMLYPEVDVIEERVPYLVIWCKGSIPESSKRPFLIASLLGVWLIDGPDNLPREFIGEDVGNINIELKVDDDLESDIYEYHIPKTETLCRLMHEHFPDALALSFVNNEYLIELPELPIEEHIQRERKLPGKFYHKARPLLKYYNGLRITGQENKRLKEPMPKAVDVQCDDSDYIAAQGYFQPGSMLREDGGNIITAGILVEKNDQKRLTVAIHCWQKELDTVSEKMSDPQFFRVRQGETHIGHVSERLETSDIGLVTLNDDVKFRNRFIDIPGGPARLLPSDELQTDQLYMVDSFTTGRQGYLLCKGKRVINPEDKQRRVDQTLRGLQKDLPEAGTYLVVVQGIYATSEPMTYDLPVIRAGVCGSALVRLAESEGSRDDGKNSQVPAAETGLIPRTAENSFTNSGEIGGFMNWSDLQEKITHSAVPRLLCYADVTDPLINSGWKVLKVAEKRKRSSSGESLYGVTQTTSPPVELSGGCLRSTRFKLSSVR